MTVSVLIPHPLRPLADGRDRAELSVHAVTVREVLHALFDAYPALRDRILTEQGTVRGHVNVFVGDMDVRQTNGLATPVPDGAEISIVPAISGG